jgi:hypothetical protein
VDVAAPILADFPEESWTFASYSAQLASDVGTTGDMARHSVAAGIGGRFSLQSNRAGSRIQARDDRLALAVQALYLGNYYQFSKDADVVNWDDIHAFSLLSILRWKLADDWTLLGGGIFRFAMESQATFHEALTGGGLLGFEYRASDTLALGLLLGAASQLEDSAALLPVPTVDWRFTDAWRFRLGVQTSLGQPGLGPELTFEPAEHWEIGIGGVYQKRRFRLRHRSSFIPTFPNRRRDGIGQETSLPLYARIRYVLPAPERGVWHPGPAQTDHATLVFDLYAGVTLGGELRVEDKTGDKLADHSYDPAATIGLRILIPF